MDNVNGEIDNENSRRGRESWRNAQQHLGTLGKALLASIIDLLST